MSARPIEQKKRRRVAKTIRRGTLPAYFDIVEWLIDHGHAKTKREARKLLLDGRVMANSHPLGRKYETIDTRRADGLKGFGIAKALQTAVDPRVPVELKSAVIVS